MKENSPLVITELPKATQLKEVPTDKQKITISIGNAIDKNLYGDGSSANACVVCIVSNRHRHGRCGLCSTLHALPRGGAEDSLSMPNVRLDCPRASLPSGPVGY